MTDRDPRVEAAPVPSVNVWDAGTGKGDVQIKFSDGPDDEWNLSIEAARGLYERLGIALRAADAVGRRWRHNKRGTEYVEIGRAKLQAATTGAAREGDTLVIYRGADGKLWAREDCEFEDGRFTPLPAPPAGA